MRKVTLEIATLSTPRGRLMFVGLASAVVYIVPFHWLASLSLWQRLGWDWAPSIGLTRSYWLLIHGRADDAASFNWLILPVIMIAIVIISKDSYKIWTTSKELSYTETKSSN